MKWTLDKLVSKPWIKITLHNSIPSTTPLREDIDRIKRYLGGEKKDYMFHPQDYRYVVKFAVEDWDTAVMVRLMARNCTIIEEVVLNSNQLAYKKSLEKT